MAEQSTPATVVSYKCEVCKIGDMLYTGVKTDNPVINPLTHDWSKPTMFEHKCSNVHNCEHTESFPVTYPHL